MADRHRSRDGAQDTRSYTDPEATPSQQGRADGTLERQVGTRDLLRQAEQDRAGITRVQKSDKRQHSS